MKKMISTRPAGLLAMLRFRASRIPNIRSSAVLASLRIRLSLAKSLSIILITGVASSAIAQTVITDPTPETLQKGIETLSSPGVAAPIEVAASPVVNTPAIPTVNSQPRPGYFPALPPARPCAAGDVQGVWRMRQTYENPSSNASADFAAYPYQYLLFSADTTYNSHKNQYEQTTAAATAQLGAAPQGLQQFLVQEGGFVFFYRDGAAIDTQACFIVATARDPFEAGQMLLMPPQGQSATRLVKVYDKIAAVPVATAPAAAPAAQSADAAPVAQSADTAPAAQSADAAPRSARAVKASDKKKCPARCQRLLQRKPPKGDLQKAQKRCETRCMKRIDKKLQEQQQGEAP